MCVTPGWSVQVRSGASVRSSEALLIQSHPHQAREIPRPDSCGSVTRPPTPLTYPPPFAYDWKRLTWGSGRILVQRRQKFPLWFGMDRSHHFLCPKGGEGGVGHGSGKGVTPPSGCTETCVGHWHESLPTEGPVPARPQTRCDFQQIPLLSGPLK